MIVVHWSAPPLEDQNGPITSYCLRYSSIEPFAGPGGELTVNVTSSMVMIDELEEYVQYSFVIAAKTLQGIGPFSQPVNATTYQDGM